MLVVRNLETLVYLTLHLNHERETFNPPPFDTIFRLCGMSHLAITLITLHTYQCTTSGKYNASLLKGNPCVDSSFVHDIRCDNVFTLLATDPLQPSLYLGLGPINGKKLNFLVVAQQPFFLKSWKLSEAS